MRLPERLSIRARLLIWVMLPVTLLALLWGGGTYLVVLHFANGVHDRGLDDMVRSVASQVRPGMNGASIDLSRAAQGIIEFDKDDLVYFCVTDAQGRMIAGNRPLPVIGGAPGHRRDRRPGLPGAAVPS